MLVVTGTHTKQGPWSMVDPDTKKYSEGYSWQLAFYGGVLKVKTEEGDPLRAIGVGEEVTLKIKISAPKGKPEQFGPAVLVDPKTLQPLTPAAT